METDSKAKIIEVCDSARDWDTILDRISGKKIYLMRLIVIMFILVSTAAMHLGVAAFIDQPVAYECALPVSMSNELLQVGCVKCKACFLKVLSSATHRAIFFG